MSLISSIYTVTPISAENKAKILKNVKQLRVADLGGQIKYRGLWTMGIVEDGVNPIAFNYFVDGGKLDSYLGSLELAAEEEDSEKAIEDVKKGNPNKLLKELSYSLIIDMGSNINLIKEHNYVCAKKDDIDNFEPEIAESMKLENFFSEGGFGYELNKLRDIDYIKNERNYLIKCVYENHGGIDFDLISKFSDYSKELEKIFNNLKESKIDEFEANQLDLGLENFLREKIGLLGINASSEMNTVKKIKNQETQLKLSIKDSLLNKSSKKKIQACLDLFEYFGNLKKSFITEFSDITIKSKKNYFKDEIYNYLKNNENESEMSDYFNDFFDELNKKGFSSDYKEKIKSFFNEDFKNDISDEKLDEILTNLIYQDLKSDIKSHESEKSKLFNYDGDVISSFVESIKSENKDNINFDEDIMKQIKESGSISGIKTSVDWYKESVKKVDNFISLVDKGLIEEFKFKDIYFSSPEEEKYNYSNSIGRSIAEDGAEKKVYKVANIGRGDSGKTTIVDICQGIGVVGHKETVRYQTLFLLPENLKFSAED